ncbi:MAG: sulfite exporter TauE/SafE family protein [Burkholderiales bacterium]
MKKYSVIASIARKALENPRVKKAAVGVVSGFLAGLFGSGGGIAVVEGLESIGTEERRAHATSLAVILPASVLSAALYFTGGYVPLEQTLYLCAGAIAGGLLGAFFLSKVRIKLLNRIFTLLILASGVRLLF